MICFLGQRRNAVFLVYSPHTLLMGIVRVRASLGLPSPSISALFYFTDMIAYPSLHVQISDIFSAVEGLGQPQISTKSSLCDLTNGSQYTVIYMRVNDQWKASIRLSHLDCSQSRNIVRNWKGINIDEGILIRRGGCYSWMCVLEAFGGNLTCWQ